MLTERIPESHYHSEFPQKHPNKKVILVNKATNQAQFCESKSLNVNEDNKLCFSDLINDLKPLYPELHRAFFFLYIDSKEYLVGADPFQQPRYIDFKVFENSDIVILYNEQKNHKKRSENLIQQEDTTKLNVQQSNQAASRKNSEQIQISIKQEEEETNTEQDINNIPQGMSEDIQKEIQKYTKPREKRVKERTIEYVIEKVKKWRTYYEQGVTNELGEDIKPNLDVAAYLVQLSRKTLDDYYAQLRKGEMYNFDFQSNKHEKMGTLRKYVKEQEKLNPNKKNKGKLSDIIDANSFGSVGSVSTDDKKIVINTNEIEESQRRKKSAQINIQKPENSVAQKEKIQENIKMETEDIEQDQYQNNNNNQNQQLDEEDQQNCQVSQETVENQDKQIIQEDNVKIEQQEDEGIEMEMEMEENILPTPEQQLEIMEIQRRMEEQKQKFRFRGYDQAQYDSIMNDPYRQSPIKSHKGSADVCDEFLDLTNNCQYSNFYE